ncbi:cupin domain-containing protein [Streptomyces humi]|uniref:cupin domain-containing protein n=1 Tax=Streptomyces humi TaxID=1428620 RepID=UPI0006289213|nr:cupin domain-containing protein [Streptomyces humi]
MTWPRVVGPGAGPGTVVGGTPVSFLVTADDTAGRFGLTEHRLPPRAPGAPLHFHNELTEMFYVVEGDVLLTLGTERRVASPGTFMLVPPGTSHAFGNPGTDPATLLVMFTPDGGRERYFRELGELLDSSPAPTAETMAELARRFDQFPATEGLVRPGQ